MSRYTTISPQEAADRLAIRELIEAYSAAPIVAMGKVRCLSLRCSSARGGASLGAHGTDE